jgi:hypothetical protein
MPDFGIFRGFSESAFSDKLFAGQLPTELGLIGTDNSVFESEYRAVIAYAKSRNYTLPSSSQQILQNNLLSSLKTAGIWAKLDSFCLFATNGSSDFALIDWKRLTQYTAVNSPTFTSNQGFQSNGTTSFINTNFNPAIDGINYQLDNASRYMWNFTTSAGSRYFDGNENSNSNHIYSNNSNVHKINTTNNLSATVALNTTGLIGINRTSSTNVELFDDTTQFSRTATSTGITDDPQWISRSANNYGTQRTSMYLMGASLVTENTDLYNAMNTYMTSI